MPTAYPNSAGCDAWNSIDSDRPPDTRQGDISETQLTAPQKDTISTDDGSYHTSSGGEMESAGHRIQFDLGTSNVDSATVTARGCCNGSDEPGWYLYVWNDSSGQWVFLDSHSDNLKQTLTGSVGDYVYQSAGHYIADIRVCGDVHSFGSGANLYFIKCDYTLSAAQEHQGTTVKVVIAGMPIVEPPALQVVKVLTGGADKPAGFDEVSVYPNSPGCSAVRGTCPVAETPDGLTQWEETSYTSAELDRISNEEADTVTQAAVEEFGEKTEDPGHRVRLVIPSDYRGNDCGKMYVTVGVYQEGPEDYAAYIWNFDTSSWDDLGLVLQAEYGTGFVSDTATIPDSNVDRYIGSSYESYVLLVDENAGVPISATLDYVCVLYWLAAAAVEHVGAVMLVESGGTDLHIVGEEHQGQTILTVADGEDNRKWRDHAGTVVIALADGSDVQIAFHTGSVVKAVTGGEDHLKFRDHLGQTVRAHARGGDRQVYHPESLGADLLIQTDGDDLKFFPSVHLGQIALVLTEGEDAVREVQGAAVAAVTGGDECLIRRDHTGAVVAVLEGGTDIFSYEPDDDGSLILVVTHGEDRWVRYERRGTVVHVISDGTDAAARLEHKGTDVLVLIGGADRIAIKDHGGAILAVVIGGAALYYLPVYVGVPGPGERELSWTAPNLPEGTVFWVLTDGRIAHRTVERSVRLPAGTQVRQFLRVMAEPDLPEDEVLQWVQTPRDIVRCIWTESPTARIYRLYRKRAGGDYEEVTALVGLMYDDGPLPDGTFTYQVRAFDAEGDQGVSVGKTVTVSSAPDPPSGLDWTWDPDLKKLTLTWQPSPSADVASYRVRSSDGADELDWNATPVQESDTLSYERTFTDESGMWILSVRALDADGNEDSNITQMVAIPFEDGAPSARPAEPRWVQARAIENGRLELEWLYDPRYEENGPGAAHEARIYWDAGTGTVDFTEPLATVEMGLPTTATSYTWQSGPLTDGQEYRFCVRIATAPWPGGTETQGTREHVMAASSAAPAAPTLTARIV